MLLLIYTMHSFFSNLFENTLARVPFLAYGVILHDLQATPHHTALTHLKKKRNSKTNSITVLCRNCEDVVNTEHVGRATSYTT